jgi:hypothetical protein
MAFQAGILLLGIGKPLCGSDFPGFLRAEGLEGSGVSGFGPDFPLISGLGHVTGLAFGGPDDFMPGKRILRMT